MRGERPPQGWRRGSRTSETIVSQMPTLTFKASVTLLRAARAARVARAVATAAVVAAVISAAQLLASGALAAGGPGAHAAGTPRLLGGVNIIGGGPADIDHAIAAARKAKARLIRTDVNWSELEPREDGKVDPAA